MDEVLPTCRELGIGFVPYSPLGRGFLTGRFNASSDFGEGDFRGNDPRMGEENFERNAGIVETVRAVADRQRRDAGPGGARLGPAPRETTWCRSPAREGSSGSRRTRRRPDLELGEADLRELEDARHSRRRSLRQHELGQPLTAPAVPRWTQESSGMNRSRWAAIVSRTQRRSSSDAIR